MIAIIGDASRTPRGPTDLAATVERLHPDTTHAVHLGVFAPFYAPVQTAGGMRTPCRRRLFVVDGHHNALNPHRELSVPSDIYRSVVYMPRGHVAILSSREERPIAVGFLGGAPLLPALVRCDSDPQRDYPFDDDLAITEADCERLTENAEDVGGLDLLITHTPPSTLVRMATGWQPDEPSAAHDVVDTAWFELGCPEIVCAHPTHSFTCAWGALIRPLEVIYR